jgi:hypothetical protein
MQPGWLMKPLFSQKWKKCICLQFWMYLQSHLSIQRGWEWGVGKRGSALCSQSKANGAFCQHLAWRHGPGGLPLWKCGRALLSCVCSFSTCFLFRLQYLEIWETRLQRTQRLLQTVSGFIFKAVAIRVGFSKLAFAWQDHPYWQPSGAPGRIFKGTAWRAVL